MEKRRLLTINGRKKVSLKLEFTQSQSKVFDKSPTNKQTAFAWARTGRQNSEGFGGGNRIQRRK
jgi:hypothetical protein